MKAMPLILALTLLAAFVALGQEADAPAREDVVEWQRGPDDVVETHRCDDDGDCPRHQRCRVLSIDGRPVVGEVYAEDVADRFASARALQAEIDASPEPLKDNPPRCDDHCGTYAGDLTIAASLPVALCLEDGVDEGTH